MKASRLFRRRLELLVHYHSGNLMSTGFNASVKMSIVAQSLSSYSA